MYFKGSHFFPQFIFQLKHIIKLFFRWDSSVGPFIFEDQFIQISTQPPSSFVYGFGEQEHKTFKHNLSAWEVLPIFTRDQFPFVSSFLDLSYTDVSIRSRLMNFITLFLNACRMEEICMGIILSTPVWRTMENLMEFFS